MGQVDALTWAVSKVLESGRDVTLLGHGLELCRQNEKLLLRTDSLEVELKLPITRLLLR